MKLQARLCEAEETMDGLSHRCTSLEKLRQKLSLQVEDLQLQVDASQQLSVTYERKLKTLDKVVTDWKTKVEDLSQQLEDTQKENRENAAQVFRLNSQLDQAKDEMESLRKENKNLTMEVKDLLDQIGDGGRNMHELQRQKRRVECEKEELANALDEAEAALEAEENRLVAAQLELASLK